jgi:hypothetical protein
MRTTPLLLAVAVLALSGTVLGAEPAPATRPAGSKIVLPVIGDLLGRRIDEVKPPPVKAGEAKEAFIARVGNPPEPRTGLVSFNYPGTVALELTVDRGLVIAATAFVRRPTPANAAAMEKRLLVNDRRVTSTKDEVAGTATTGPLWRLSFATSTAEAYIAAGGLSGDIAAGVRGKKWTPGMSSKDQFFINDGPGTYVIKIGLKERTDAESLLRGSAREIENPGAVALGGDYTQLTIKASGRGEAIEKAQPSLTKNLEIFSVDLKEAAPPKP